MCQRGTEGKSGTHMLNAPTEPEQHSRLFVPDANRNSMSTHLASLRCRMMLWVIGLVWCIGVYQFALGDLK